ncbi:MAG: DUF4277 domain-containing protein, partial [Chloroflexi bacterium]|nr:DUF4277 domain-containing protein [Chloroflexota bacterium]
ALRQYKAWKHACRQAKWAARRTRLAMKGATTLAQLVDLLTKRQMHYQIGALPMLYALLESLQVRHIINRHCPTQREVDHGTVVLVLVLNRLMYPSPLYRVADWVGRTTLVHILGVPALKFNDDRLNRTLDALYPHLEIIWLELVEQAMRKANIDMSVIFYDLTAFIMHGRAGDIIVIFDRKNRFLAVGLYDAQGPIRVRILHVGDPVTIDGIWLRAQLAAAAARRTPLLQTNSTGYRLVHGENDGLPGLVIDRYGETAVIKLYTTAWLPYLGDVLAGLMGATAVSRTVLRLSRSLQQHPEELYGLTDGQLLAGEPTKEPECFLENGLIFEVDVIQGQKTGFFLDQRDNRARVEKMATGKRVLNLFAYTGGFSLYAARGGARQVISLDRSQPALAAAVRNFKLNQADARVAACEHEILLGDAFQSLSRMAQSGQSFDMVIIDPPSFAKKQTEVERALWAYGRLVRLGLEVLAPNGILVMASCSSRVDADTFFQTVHQVARRGGRPLQEIERTGHALDHPITFREGAYLKCLFASVPLPSR